MKSLKFPLEDYPKLQAWCERLMERESVQTASPTPEEVENVYWATPKHFSAVYGFFKSILEKK